MTNTMQTLRGNAPEEQARKNWDLIYSALFLLAFGLCLLLGVFPRYNSYLALLILMCAVASFFGDYYYLYLALFMFVRHRTIISTIPAFELYAYLMLVKFLTEAGKIRIRVPYLPMLSVLLLHTILAASQVDLAEALRQLVFLIVMYGSLSKLLADDALMRKFLTAFLMGGIVSWFYGVSVGDAVHEMRVAGSGVYEVTQNFGILTHAAFAATFYNAAIFISLFLKGIPKPLRVVLVGGFFLLLLQTTNMAGLITCCCSFAIATVLKFRKKSVFILAGVVVAAAVALSIPQVRQIQTISNILLRIGDALHHLRIGRWDLLTTNRTELWEISLNLFKNKSLAGKLFGGSVITVNITGAKITTFFNACHQSIIQGMLNFGIIGTALIYGSAISAFLYRCIRHLFQKPGYENEDIKIIQILLAGILMSMGMAGDFFSDWAYMLLLFI